MKKFKKLIPAFCAMLVSAAMLGTSTYAWFSVNKKVEANNMSVTAVANTQYFVVLNSVAGGDFTAEGKTETTKTTLGNPTAGGIKGPSTNVYPAAYTTDALSLASGTGTGVEANNWYTGGVSADQETTGGENSKFTTLTTLGADAAATFTTNTDYFVAYTFYVGLADKTDSCSAKLKFTATDATNAAKIAGLTVQSSDPGAGAAKYTSYAGKTTEAVETTDTFDFVAKNGATSAKYVTVTVYVYIDGTNTEIMSKNLNGENATKLTGSIGVQVDAVIE